MCPQGAEELFATSIAVDTLRFAFLNCRVEFELDQSNCLTILLPTFLNI